MNVLVISGSRADYGLLEPVMEAMKEDAFFEVEEFKIWGRDFSEAAKILHPEGKLPDLALVLGDRYEILAAAANCHLLRVPIAHIAGGDVTEGSYDDAMRDCITRMSCLHFTTSTASQVRVQYLMGQKNVHMVGSPGVDYIMRGDWKGPRPYIEPYVVVAYYPETIDGTNEIESVIASLPRGKFPVFIMPNPDAGSAEIRDRIMKFYLDSHSAVGVYDGVPRKEFLNLLYHCDEFIGNSSAIYYDAPFLGIKTREIGKRQKGRVIPFGDGRACEKIVKALKEWHV